MKREYTIIIDAKGAHQPSQDEIFQAVRKLVDARTTEFPKPRAGTHVTLIPRRWVDIEKLRAVPSPPRQPHARSH